MTKNRSELAKARQYRNTQRKTPIWRPKRLAPMTAAQASAMKQATIPTGASSTEARQEFARHKRQEGMRQYRQHLINVRKAKGQPKSLKTIEHKAWVRKGNKRYILNTDFILHPDKGSLPDLDNLTRFSLFTNKQKKKR